VTKELIARGYNVIAFAREQAGIKGKMGKEDTKKVRGQWGGLMAVRPAAVCSGPLQQQQRRQRVST
jgi:hypothetical protein